MKFELNDSQKKRLERMVEQNPVRRYYLNIEHHNFEIGDVLVKKTKHYQGSWKYETVSSGNQMPQRYVYVFKDEFNIGYVKQLRVSDGKLGDEIYCLVDYDFESCRFEVDPEYAEKIFLDADFDIKEVHRASLEARKLVIKANRKIGVKPKTLKQFNEFFAKLKVGDTLWVSSDFTCKWLQEYEITEINTVTDKAMDASRDWQWDGFRRKERQEPNTPKFIDDTIVYKVKTKDKGQNRSNERDTYCYDFGRESVFYTTQPGVEEKKK